MRPLLTSLILTLLLTLTHFTPPTQARQTPTSFCKCICFTNSTIIPLNAPQSSKSSHRRSIDSNDNLLSIRVDDDDDDNDQQAGDSAGEGESKQHHRELTCNDCNRAFCLDYNLPICKGAKEEDVFTSCFQRDSVKDETVVLIFILLTASLLSWALLKPWIEKVRGGSSSGEGSVTDLASGSSFLGGLRGGDGSGGRRAGGNSRSLLPTSARAEYNDEDEDDDQDESQRHDGGGGGSSSSSRGSRTRRGLGGITSNQGSISRQGGLNS